MRSLIESLFPTFSITTIDIHSHETPIAFCQLFSVGLDFWLDFDCFPLSLSSFGLLITSTTIDNYPTACMISSWTRTLISSIY